MGVDQGFGLLADPDEVIVAIGGGAPAPDPLVVMLGDSLVYGIMDANNIGAVRWFGVNDAFAPVTFASQQAPNTTDPPPFLPGGTPSSEIGPESLVAYNPGASPGAGFEITLMRQLNAINPKYAYLVKCGIIAALLDSHWLDTASYDTVGGGNLFSKQVARIHAAETATGRQTRIIVPVLGTNDGSASGPAGRMTSNMGAFCDALHTAFPNAVIVWPLVNIHTVQTPDNIPTVRTQMLAFATAAAATRPYFMLVNIDHLQLAAGDPFHWDMPSVLAAGRIFAYAGIDLLGQARQAAVTTPALVGVGVPQIANGASATLTPLPEAGTLDNDTCLAFALTNSVTPGGTQAITCSAGWTLVPGASGQVLAVGFTTTWVVYKRKVPPGEFATNALSPSQDRRTSPPTFTVSNGGDSYAQVLTVRGPTSGNQDVDASQVGIFTGSFGTGPFTVPAMTTIADNDLCIYIVGGAGSTGDVSTLTAAGVTGLTKIGESYFVYTSGDSVLIAIYVGTKPAHGSTGTASLSFTLNTLPFAAAVALKP